MRYRKSIGMLNILLIFMSCDLASFYEDFEGCEPEETAISEESSLFVTDDETEVYTFETNDRKYISEKGYTLWKTLDSNAGEDFIPLSLTVCKESGRSEAGFGTVFCVQEIDGKSFMLAILINANGYYTIGKITEGIFSHITGWENSDYINKGFGIKNLISVSYDSENKNFVLVINGHTVTAFAVSEDIVFKGSKSGYVVVIANNEAFPDNPVKVTFEKTRQFTYKE